jgi:peroxiredoxin
MSSSGTTEPRRRPSPMMMVSIGIGVVAAVALITVVSILTGAKVTNGPSKSAPYYLIGKKAFDFSLAGLNGGTVGAPYADHHATVLIFFASWCPPCKGEIPRVTTYLRAHPPAGVSVVGVDSNDQNAAAQSFVARAGFTYPIAVDASGTVTAADFGFATLPETVFVSASGVVREVHFGAISNAQLAAGIRAITRS